MKNPGNIKLLKEDIINNGLKRDSVLSQWKCYNSQWEVSAKTKKPCHSIDLNINETGDLEANGGRILNRKIQGIIITYIDPLKTKNLTELLDELIERTDIVLEDSSQTGQFQHIFGYKYGRGYTKPFTITTNEGPKLVAHRVITEFEIQYEVR